ncbi:coiled-coil-helix-coiled-coil-helix domain containing 3 [Anticarsia gemmatalis]|uniref:coiled-coil-helix-coiled-coil-helix domain containing 3 n=1 Tax=Anticarsia gemmatalis TaxID=129554 RepID=UPI003F758F19
MGGSQSTRKVTVDNEHAIQVSREALDRIQAQLDAKQAEQPVAQPAPQYLPPPPYDHKRQQEYAAEEAYWAQRIESLKRQHEKINSGMHLEYQKTLKEANELFNMVQGDKVVTKLAPCQEEKAKVLQCYSTNPDKTLVCSVLVNEFNDCVCKSRVAAVTASS